MRRARGVGALLLLVAVLMVAFAAIGGVVISCGSISDPSIHSPVITAPVTAQERAYLNYLRAHELTGSDSLLLQEGRMVCEDFRNDPNLTYTEEKARSGMRMGNTGLTEIVDATLIYLCDGQGL